MNTQEFEKHIKETISQDLFIEETRYNDIDRVMLANTPKGTLYICAVPKKGVKDEIDPNYISEFGLADKPHIFPSRPMIEDKIKAFIKNLPENLELYD